MRIHFHTQKEKKNKNYLRLKKEKKKKERKKYNGYTVYFVIIVFRNNIIVTPCKGVRIPESGKFLLVETGILENFVKESGVPGRRKTQKPCKVEPKFKSKPCYPSFHLSALSFQLSSKIYPPKRSAVNAPQNNNNDSLSLSLSLSL